MLIGFFVETIKGNGMRVTLEKFFQKIGQAQIPYCVLRDADQLERIAPKMEIDLLVDPKYLQKLQQIMSESGFIHLDDWGYYPHNFFLLYDEEGRFWLKIDVVSEVNFGSPIPALRSNFRWKILRNRQLSGNIFTPSPVDEFITLLLHCLLDKGFFTPARRQRIRILLDQVTSDFYFSKKVSSYFDDPKNWTRVEALVRKEKWEELLSDKQAISRYILQENPFITAVQIGLFKTLRLVNRLRRFVRPFTPSIAMLAPDGAGKSTLAHNLKESSYFPVTTVYMGLYPKQTKGRKVNILPGFNLVSKIIIIWKKYLNARYHQARGHLVVFDRYIYDALMPSKSKLGRSRQISRWLISHSCPAPDLVTILDAPGEILFTRKGEQNPEFLEEQRQAYHRIKDQLTNAVVLDATQSLETNKYKIISLVWRLTQGKKAGINFKQIVLAWNGESISSGNQFPPNVEARVEA